MKKKLKTSLKFERGEANSLSFNPLSLGNLMNIEKRGGINKKNAQAYIFSLGTANDGSFELTESDFFAYQGFGLQRLVAEISRESSLVDLVKIEDALSGSDKKLYENAIKFEDDNEHFYKLQKGEFISPDPLINPSILKLTSPVSIKIEGVEELIEFVSLGKRTYGDLENELTEIYTNELSKVKSFISQYLEPYNHQNEHMLLSIFNLQEELVRRISAKDFYRINALLYSPFMQADLSLFENV